MKENHFRDLKINSGLGGVVNGGAVLGREAVNGVTVLGGGGQWSRGIRAPNTASPNLGEAVNGQGQVVSGKAVNEGALLGERLHNNLEPSHKKVSGAY